jgi:hypothetical protein
MKSKQTKRRSLLAIALVAVMVTAGGCAMLSTTGGTGDVHGLFTFNVPSATDGFTEIGSYVVILGLVDSGFSEYAAKVKQAEAARKQITTVTKFYYFFTKTTAYAK